MKKNWRKGLAVITAAALVITTAVLPGGASAKGKVKLNKKKVTMKVGQKVKLKLKNTKNGNPPKRRFHPLLPGEL